MPRRQDVKAALLRAAKELFSSQGYQHTTVQAITAQAGVATGSFYSYFSSKEACFLALTEILYEALLTAVLQERRQVPDGLPKLERSLAAAVDVFLHDPTLARAVLGQMGSREPLVGARLEEVKSSLVSFLAQDLGDLRPPHPTPVLTAHMLFGALAESLQAHLSGALPPPEAAAFRTALLAQLDRLLALPPPSIR